jgi:hypothetical protein
MQRPTSTQPSGSTFAADPETYLCEHVLHSAGEKEFYDAVGRMSDQELTDIIHKMQKKRLVTMEVVSTQISAYA